MHPISPFLMFSGERHGLAKPAVEFYVALFPNSVIDSIAFYGPGEFGPEGSVKVARFTLNGQPFMAIDSSAPHTFNFTPSLSLYIDCSNDAELEQLYAALSQGGQALMPLDNYGFSRRFGWVSDRFGVSWQLNLP